MPTCAFVGMRVVLLSILLATAGTSLARAQDTDESTAAATQPASAPALMPNRSPTAPPDIPFVERSPFESLVLPDIQLPPAILFGAVVVLILFLSNRPFTTGRSLDAIILAAGCVLLALRGGTPALFGPNTTWLTYTLLTVFGAYWLARGLVFMRASHISRAEVGVGEAAQGVLAVAALLLALHTIANAPLTQASQDGLVGGIHLLDTGTMPYGVTVGYDGQSPLLYAAHAAVAHLMPPEIAVGSELIPLTWDKRHIWEHMDWPEAEGVAAARMVNALLFLLAIIGLTTLGRWLHSTSMGLALATAFAVLPGISECLTRPDILLPMVLLIWTLVFATLPGLFALFASAILVIAGLAWPWLWLALPALLLWFVGRGWAASAGAIGMVGGTAAAVWIAIGLTLPGPPRADGAIAAAGITTSHVARVQNGSLLISAQSGNANPASGIRAQFWQMLLDQETGRLRSQASTLRFEEAANTGGGELIFRELAVEAGARERLIPLYREAVAENGYLPHLRTLLESVWLPTRSTEPTARGAWMVWSAENPDREAQIVNIRRAIKVAAGILALLLAVMVIANRLNQPYQLVGVVTAICAAALIASESGAVANQALLLTPALLLFAVDGRATTLGGLSRPSPVPLPAAPTGSGPRISVE